MDLVIDRHAYRLLLAFTSARNFLEYAALLKHQGLGLFDIDHEIRVNPRGSWGEVLFSRPG